VDRERTAALLGFDGVVENSMDAVSTRDFLVETNAAPRRPGDDAVGLAEDVIGFASKGHVELADEYASTSSIMPQKKNPDTMELVRGRTGDATAGLNGLLTTLKGLPRAYNRDLQRATTHVWGAVDAVTESVEVATGAVATAEWPEDVLAAAAGEGSRPRRVSPTCFAKSGIPFRTAHEVVATVAGQDYEGRRPTTRRWIRSPRTFWVSRSTRTSNGRPSRTRSTPPRERRDAGLLRRPCPDAVTEQLSAAEQALAGHRETLATERGAVESVAEALQTEVERYV